MFYFAFYVFLDIFLFTSYPVDSTGSGRMMSFHCKGKLVTPLEDCPCIPVLVTTQKLGCTLTLISRNIGDRDS